MRYASILYHTKVSSEKIPDTIDIGKVIGRYSKHSCHHGSWPKDTPKPTRLPAVEETSHVVQDVKLNDSGGLDVSFVMIASPRGFRLMDEFDKHRFEMLPIISEDGESILRFDFIKEE